MNRRGSLAPVAAASLAAIFLGTPPASADVDNSVPNAVYDVPCFNAAQDDPQNVCQTDNVTLVVYKQGSLTNASSGAVNTTLFNSYDGTDLNASVTSSPVYSGGAETDIIYQQGTSGFSGSTIGITWCDDAVNGTTYDCDQQYVKFKITADRALACHETGHAVGLLHGQSSSPYTLNDDPILGCMIKPHDPVNQYLEASNVANINATY